MCGQKPKKQQKQTKTRCNNHLTFNYFSVYMSRCGLGVLCLKQLLKIFQLYRNGQFCFGGGGNRRTWGKSHNAASSTIRHGRDSNSHNISGDRHWLHN